MEIERSQAIEADPYERNERRRGYANGFKPKTLETRLGPITSAADPWSRVLSFAAGEGVGSERALKLAVAEMYVQGVSTREVTEVMQQLCGLEVSSTQVSRAAKLLDEELNTWRNRHRRNHRFVVVFCCAKT
jgi:putative transposase